MRQVEKNMLQAVRAGKNFKCGNTEVKNGVFGEVFVYLHGNCIYRIIDGVREFTLSGWNTVTTRSRLNALGVNVSQKNWEPIYNGTVINSYNWYTV